MATALEKIKYYRFFTVLTCISGILISLYAYHVGSSKAKDDNYTATCDISENISCTKVFASPFGKGFGLFRFIIPENSYINQPNSIFGIIFYTVLLLLNQKLTVTVTRLQVALSILGNLGSIYLGCILIFVLRNLCLVCIATYVLNAILLYCGLKKLSLLEKVQTKANDRKKAS